MSGILGSVVAEADKAENWVEKEVGLVEKRVTRSTVYHSAEHIAGILDKWLGGMPSSLDAETVRYYSEAVTMIKALF